jgi:hypothetical protein
MRLAAAVVLAALLAGVSGCSSSDDTASSALPDDAVVTYVFTDASVPPSDHRSFSVTVTPATSSIVVDSYGEVLAQRTVPTPPELWAELSDTLPTLRATPTTAEAPGCVGGTSARLSITQPAGQILFFAPDTCAGANEAASDALDAWLEPVLALFPSVEELAPSG